MGTRRRAGAREGAAVYRGKASPFVEPSGRCSDRLALCKQTCGKRHESRWALSKQGVWGAGCAHLCEQRCHEGSCGKCDAKVLCGGFL